MRLDWQVSWAPLSLGAVGKRAMKSQSSAARLLQSGGLPLVATKELFAFSRRHPDGPGRSRVYSRQLDSWGITNAPAPEIDCMPRYPIDASRLRPRRAP